MKKYLLFWILLTQPFIDSAQGTTCECPPQAKPVRESYAQAGVVFVGTVQKFGKSALRPGMNEAVLKVMSKYKGLEELKGSTLYVYTPESKQQCGVNFIVSQDYLVYAEGGIARPVAVSCSRTDILDNALDSLEELQRLSSKR